MKISSSTVVLFVMLGMLSFSSGCNSTPQMPSNKNFILYAKIIKEMQNATSLAMEKNYNWDRKIFIDEALRDGKKIDELALIKSGSSSLEHAANAPLYIKIKEDILTFNEINYAMVKYSNVLKLLSARHFSEKEYLMMAERSDATCVSVMNGLQKKYGPSNVSIVPLGSHEIISKLREKNSYRKNILETLLPKTQPEIDYFCKICLNIIEEIEKNMSVPYEARLKRLKSEFDAISQLPAPPANDKNSYVELESRKKRKEIILREISIMNETFLYASSILQEAKYAYSSNGIPKAHSLLLEELRDPSTSTVPIESLFESTSRLKMKIYIEAKTSKNNIMD